MPYRFARLLSSIYRSLYFPPAVITAAILVATGLTWHAAQQSLARDTQSAINEHIDDNERSVTGTLNSYNEILEGGVGLFQASNEVTAADWSNFLKAFDIKEKLPSAQTIGFVKVIKPGEASAFTAYMRTQPTFENYTIHSQLPADQSENTDSTMAPLMYAQSVALQTPVNFGFDLYTDMPRRKAMLQAQDSGKTATTDRLTLHPSGDKKTYQGFTVYVPYYTGGPQDSLVKRQETINGYVYASFRADLFFKYTGANLARSRTSAYQVYVKGNSSDKPLYQTGNYASLAKKRNVKKASKVLHMYGRDWSIDYIFEPTDLLSNVQLNRPTSVLTGGVLSALLIGMIVLLLLKARAHELTIQKERAVELAKDELLSLASHQLRTPATGVKQYLGMILQGFAGDATKEQMELIGKAYASNDRQLHIINEILHLAKIESGRIVLARTETDLNSLVNDILTELQPDIEAAKHNVEVIVPKRSLILNIDPHTLRMAIENIVSNALKYTPRGGDISIKLHKTHEHVFIRVKDSGVGISPQDTDKLFKQFSRLPNEMSLSVGGTGIGLYLAKHLVELHGGTITVKSAQGKGATFTIILPLD
jgi:signal transduction histidine kinase